MINYKVSRVFKYNSYISGNVNFYKSDVIY